MFDQQSHTIELGIPVPDRRKFLDAINVTEEYNVKVVVIGPPGKFRHFQVFINDSDWKDKSCRPYSVRHICA